jgi:hypothetical protein
MRTFNEGEACDAIIGHIEAREGHRRQNLRFPEKEGYNPPIELACSIRADLHLRNCRLAVRARPGAWLHINDLQLHRLSSTLQPLSFLCHFSGRNVQRDLATVLGRTRPLTPAANDDGPGLTLLPPSRILGLPPCLA